MKERMTGRQKIEAALSPEGTAEIAAVICYEGIYIRDHWPEFEAGPWWLRESPEVATQLVWRRQVIEQTGQDWFALPTGRPRDERERVVIEEHSEGVFRRDRLTGQMQRLTKPQVGGWGEPGQVQSIRPGHLASSVEEIEAVIPIPPAFDPRELIRSGRGDLPAKMLAVFGAELYPIRHISSPLWSCYNLWGFEGMMTMLAEHPQLVRYACERFLRLAQREVQVAATLGTAGIWIEECLTDLISPKAFTQFNLPYLRPLVEAIRAAEMKSIYYYCGNPVGKWELLLDVGADALSLEEGKKGWMIDIEEVVQRVQGRCCVLGNLDAIHLLPEASDEDLRAEIARQIAAGRRNGSRFIMSIGSPVTPGTPVRRVKRYCDLVHEIGR